MSLVTNYYPNPQLVASGALHSVSNNGGTIAYANHHLQLRASDPTGCQAALGLPPMPAGRRMVVAFACYTPEGSTTVVRNGGLCTVGYSDGTGWKTLLTAGRNEPGKTVTVNGAFTMPDNQPVATILFNTPQASGAYAVFDMPSIMTQEDWDWWKANRPAERLAGDTMPLT